ncbi:MAG: hypothetical protein ABEH81_04705 [Halopenitus sp.]
MTGTEPGAGTRERGRDRAQLVVLAAAAIALAIFPLALAYLQLGYAGDVAAEPTEDAPSAELERALDRAAHAATDDVAGEYAWEDRKEAVAAYKEGLGNDLTDLETARLSGGVAAEIEYQQAVARTVAENSCPSGPARKFGPCEAIDGVVVQERAGETVVLAVAFDVRLTRPDGVTELTLVIDLDG